MAHKWPGARASRVRSNGSRWVCQCRNYPLWLKPNARGGLPAQATEFTE
jgi:hypothetical protein